MKPLKESISITIDGNILSKIKELAEMFDRSVSQYINMVLKEHLNNRRINEIYSFPSKEKLLPPYDF